MTAERRTLEGSGGVVLRRDLLARGYDDRAIAAMVRSGLLVKIRHGSYAPADTWNRMGPEDRHRTVARAVLLTARSPVVLSHVTAAVEWGADVWDLDLTEVDVTRLDGKSGRR